MNVEKELAKKMKREEKARARYKRFEEMEKRRHERRKKMRPFIDRWHSLFRRPRFNWQVRLIAKRMIKSAKREYVLSLSRGNPTASHVVIADETETFNEEYCYPLYMLSANNFSGDSRFVKPMRHLRTLRYTDSEEILNGVKETINKHYSGSFHASDIQYQLSKFGLVEQPIPYFVLSIPGPHPRKKL